MNHFVLLGRLCADPEAKKIGDKKKSTVLTDFRIAVQGIPDQEGNPRADFLSCEAWGVTGANIAKFFKKGDMILVSGRISAQSWETEEGEKRYKTALVVNSFDFCGGKKTREEEEEDEEEDLPFDEPKAKKTYKRR